MEIVKARAETKIMQAEVLIEMQANKYDNNRLIKANRKLGENAEKGNKASGKTINTQEIKQNFGHADALSAKLYSMFGDEMGSIEEEKYMLKVHHFDLANLIKDSELIG